MRKKLNSVVFCKLREFDSNGITLEIKRIKHHISWDDVKHLHAATSRIRKGIRAPIECILNDGSHYRIRFLKQDTESVLLQLYPFFEANLRKQKTNIHDVMFIFPISWVNEKRNSFKFGIFMWTLGILFCLMFLAYALINFVEFRIWLIYLQFAIPVIMFGSAIFYSHFRYRRLINATSMLVENHSLQFFKNSSQHKYSLSDVKHHKLTKTEGRIVFSDNKEICDLEKVSYWPILREYLLSKLS